MRLRASTPNQGRTAREPALILLAVVAAAAADDVLAGTQQYEPLAASVQVALHDSVADQASTRLAFATPEDGRAWLASMSRRLQAQIPDEKSRTDFLTTVHYEASRAGLDPQLVLGVIDVESRFRKYAVSNAGARGYMQVMPFWVELIGNAEHNLFNLRTNLRYGCVILRHYLDMERGDLYRALARYNGSLASNSTYATRVVKTWQQRWSLAPRRVTTVKAGQSQSLRYMGEAR
ncbi:MAG: transglycosylase [Proteobacteria bacterium]|nr:MAG: transglycosylase [Pseudomonadota bacterium]